MQTLCQSPYCTRNSLQPPSHHWEFVAHGDTIGLVGITFLLHGLYIGLQEADLLGKTVASAAYIAQLKVNLNKESSKLAIHTNSRPCTLLKVGDYQEHPGQYEGDCTMATAAVSFVNNHRLVQKDTMAFHRFHNWYKPENSHIPYFTAIQLCRWILIVWIHHSYPLAVQ